MERVRAYIHKYLINSYAKVIILGTQVPHGNMLNMLKDARNNATRWSVIKHFTFGLITHVPLGVIETFLHHWFP